MGGTRRHWLVAAGQLLAAALVAVGVAAVAAAALMHMVDPAHYGLWTGPSAFFFGSADGPEHVHQVPGRTLYLVAFWTVAVGGLVCRELVGYARSARGKNDAK